MQTGRRVLIVDDDEGVRTAVTWALEADGFEVQAVENGLEAIKVIESSALALVVLDLSLPGLGGLDILNRVRTAEAESSSWRLPIIVLSGRDSDKDRIIGLDLGADDYLVKPFSPGELAARARSLLRRSAEPNPNNEPGPNTEPISNTTQGQNTGSKSNMARPFKVSGNGVEIDQESRDVWLNGLPIELAAKEFDLLAYFISHPHRACRRSELLSAVWSSASGWQTEATVTEHVYRLRNKIELDPQHPKWLLTVRSVGYKWEG